MRHHRLTALLPFLLFLGGANLGAASRGLGLEFPSQKPEVFAAPYAPRDFLPTIWRNRDGHIVRIERGNVTQTFGRGIGGRINSATSNVSGAPSFAYQSHDAQGRRTAANTNRGNWEYEYRGGENGDGQLHKATHTGSWDFVYNTDGIGRRVSVSNPASNGSLLANDDWNDPLNRFLSTYWLQQRILRASLDREASVVITDSSALADTLLPGLTPNPQQPLREIVHALTPPGPGGGWTAWSITGTLEGGGDPGAAPDRKAKLAGLALFPPALETFTYDDAGNRSSSARWLYTYDGLNRLTRAVNKSLLENDPNNNEGHEPEAWDVEFTYDAEGRRHSKTSKLYRDGALKDTTLTTWIWDGWHPVIERVIDAKLNKPVVERKLVWGPDLSGQPGGAGGAGGLLLIRETNHTFDGRPPVTTDLLPLYDGSGNIVGLANPQGDLLAEYWYGPFGELLEATGSHAATNPWRWATKPLDPETGLVYFGLRYYDPATAQWLGREPLGEGESLNLYSYCHNDPINRVDVLGAAEYDKVPTGWKVEDGKPMVQYTTYLLPWHNWITGSQSVVSEGWEPATQAQRNQGWKFHYNDGWKLGPEPALQQQMATVGENMKGGPEFCQTLLVGSWTSVAAAPLIVPLATVEGGSSAYVLAANGARAAWTHGGVRLAGYFGMGTVAAGTGYGLATDQNFRGEFITAEMATGLPGEGLLLFGRGLQMAGRDAKNWMQGFDYLEFASRANRRNSFQLFPEPSFVVPQNNGRTPIDPEDLERQLQKLYQIGLARQNQLRTVGNNLPRMPTRGFPDTIQVDIRTLEPPPGGRSVFDPSRLADHGPFEWERYSPILVRVIGGRIYVVNGMTRVENALRSGITHLPAKIIP